MYLMVLAMGIWIGAVSHNADDELFIKGLTLSLLQRILVDKLGYLSSIGSLIGYLSL
jgi:L-cysteine desulfidase